ncbi:MAG: OmpH family outer membrane protein [Bacteroidales bacterium]|nr:OmpH family outer membrane protein [Bacteroidales bacterium]
MKKIIVIAFALFAMIPAKAQSLKFGHVNLQEVVYLMSEMDSARAQLERYQKDIQETYQSMANEFQNKLNDYQAMAANWTPATRQMKETELQEMENRLQQFQQSAQQEMAQYQQNLLAPIQEKAVNAVQKVGKAQGLIYVFDIAAIHWVDEKQSMNVDDLVKKELNIPLDKKITAAQ